MENRKAKIKYFTLTDEMRKQEKLDWFAQTKLKDIPFETIKPDKHNNWLNITDNDFEDMISIVNKQTKLSKTKNEEKAIFKLYSLGVVTARDEWVYDANDDFLEKKVNFLINLYNSEVNRLQGIKKENIKDNVDYAIKWTRAVKNDLSKGKIYSFDNKKTVDCIYRPFIKRKLYFAKELNEMQYQLNNMFGIENKLIAINHTSNKPFNVFVVNSIPDYHINGDAICISLYRFDKEGTRIDNITDWGLKQFRKNYEKQKKIKNKVFVNEYNHVAEPQVEYKTKEITKEDIFHYTYGVLHNPAYRKKYEINLKREFPRLPFYKDFYKWVNWGKELMDLHINYEEIEPYKKLRITNYELQKENPKAKLRRDKTTNEIILDENTTIKGIPSIAFDYKLGNRSAIDWILDQHKEKKPRDKTIREKFNTYKFADYKDKVIDLIQRVTTVSVKTMEIVNLMEAEEWHK